jgi:hypothetical protein
MALAMKEDKGVAFPQFCVLRIMNPMSASAACRFQESAG